MDVKIVYKISIIQARSNLSLLRVALDMLLLKAIIGASVDRKATAWLRSSHGHCGVCRQELCAFLVRHKYLARSGTSRGRLVIQDLVLD